MNACSSREFARGGVALESRKCIADLFETVATASDRFRIFDRRATT